MDVMVKKIVFYSMILFVLASAQNDERDGLKSCNVACNCNSDLHEPTRSTLSRGPTGKQGSKGISGQKGEKGDFGVKGKKGENAYNAAMLSQILGALSATSCQELKVKYGIGVSGYYLMMDPTTRKPLYNYCDFRRYTGATTCLQLFENYNITRRGSYILGQGSDDFQFCERPIFTGIYTCQELHDRYTSVNVSGFYEFKSPESEPFRVYCNFSQTPVATEVHHDMMKERLIMSSCEDPGCFGGIPLYNVAAAAIKKVIDNSVSCRQFITLRCQGVLLGWKGSFNRGWWIARNGERMNYWGGATRTGYCACGETGTCIDNSFKCNCDQNSNTLIASDEGYLTDKTKLPLREIRVGDMGDQAEIAWYAIGKLECFGQV